MDIGGIFLSHPVGLGPGGILLAKGAVCRQDAGHGTLWILHGLAPRGAMRSHAKPCEAMEAVEVGELKMVIDL